MHGHMVDLSIYMETSGERNFIEQTKTPTFLEAVLAIEIMYEPQFNLEEEFNLSILKDDFSSRLELPNFTSIASVLLDWSNKTR